MFIYYIWFRYSNSFIYNLKLVKYKFISSIRELKRNRPDLDKFYDPNELDFLEIKIGKKKVCIVIGER